MRLLAALIVVSFVPQISNAICNAHIEITIGLDFLSTTLESFSTAEYKNPYCVEWGTSPYRMFGEHSIRNDTNGSYPDNGLPRWELPSGGRFYSRVKSAAFSYSNCYTTRNWSQAYPSAALPDSSVSEDKQTSGCAPPPPPPDPPDGGDIQVCHTCDDPLEPLVLDLNGDGIVTTGIDEPVEFDLDADGLPETITWTDASTEEGFLWIDLNFNHYVDNGGELFGIGTRLPTGDRAKNGFEALAVYDDPSQGGNSDGKISIQDHIWGRLRAWVDRNHDGISQPTELIAIHRFGTLELDLSYVFDSTPAANGNVHLLRSKYWRRETARAVPYDLHGLAFQLVDR